MAYAGFRDYLSTKRQKLQDQAQENVNEVYQQSPKVFKSSISSIFSGLTLYFNGYTGTAFGILEMKETVVLRGGKVQDYMDSNITHIIAVQLTDAKIRKWKKPIVRPEWVSDSAHENVLLNWRNYNLLSSLNPSQKKLLLDLTPEATERNADWSFEDSKVTLPALRVATCPQGNDSSETISLPVEIAPNSRYSTRPEVEMNGEWVKRNSATAPQFVTRYFESSRLHHISTLRNELKFLVRQELEKKFANKPQQHDPKQRIIMHVDMDCFFASIASRDNPDLLNKPVAVAHSSGSSGKSTSEIASCNYQAREFGIYNGMTVGRSKELCPSLCIAPYNFEAYEVAAKQIYSVLLKYADNIQAVSVDEAYIDVSWCIQESLSCMKFSLKDSVFSLSDRIRNDIKQLTGCSASVGISHNMLLSRIATSKGKPDGIYYIESDHVEQLLSPMPVKGIPGVGSALSDKLSADKIITCGNLQQLSLLRLQKDYGEKTGKMLYESCRGIDNRPLQNLDRQSVGVEVNWGVRFENLDQIEKFFEDLATELHKRLKNSKKGGKLLTLKVKKRMFVKEAFKVLGCGQCGLDLLPQDVRGIGLHVTKLIDECSIIQSSKSINSAKNSLISSFIKPRKRQLKVQSSKIDIIDNIDMNIFKQLPKEIQEEYSHYLKDHEHIDESPECKADLTCQPPFVDPLVQETPTTDMLDKSTGSPLLAKPAVNKSIFLERETLPLLKTRLDNSFRTECDQSQIKEYVNEYIYDLMSRNKLEDAASLLRFFKRKIEDHEIVFNSEFWSSFYDEIKFLVDVWCYEKYGAGCRL